MIVYVTACRLIAYVSAKCMQPYVSACKLLSLHATYFYCMHSVQPKECTQTEFNCITLLFHGFDLLTDIRTC